MKISIEIFFMFAIFLMTNIKLLADPEKLFRPPSERYLNGISSVDYYFYIKDTIEISKGNNKFDSLYDSDFWWENNIGFTKLIVDGLNEQEVTTVFNKMKGYKENINTIFFINCSFEKLPEPVKQLKYLSELYFENCNNIKSFNNYNSSNSVFSIFFQNCRIQKLPEGIENLNSMLKLWIRLPDDFNQFNLDDELIRFEDRQNILSLYIRYKKADHFPENIFKLRMLNTLVFQGNKNIHYPQNFAKLPNLRYIFITSNKAFNIENFNTNLQIKEARYFDYLDDIEYNKSENKIVPIDSNRHHYFSHNSWSYFRHWADNYDFYFFDYRYETGVMNNVSHNYLFTDTLPYHRYPHKDKYDTLNGLKLRVKRTKDKLLISFYDIPEKDNIEVILRDQNLMFYIEKFVIKNNELVIDITKYVSHPTFLEIKYGNDLIRYLIFKYD